MILITDGESNRDSEKTIPEAQRAKANNIEVIVIGISRGVKRQEVEAIASEPHSSHLFLVNNFDSLSTSGEPLLNTLNRIAGKCQIH